MTKVLGIFILLALIYLGLTLGLPVDDTTLSKYGLTVSQAHLLQLTIAIPIVLIWGVAYYGYSVFKQYADLVTDSREGQGWRYIAQGLLMLALWLPITSIFSQIASVIYDKNHDLIPAMVIIQNYLNLIIVLAAFIFLYRGANRLVKSIDMNLPRNIYGWGMALLVAGSAIFVYVTLVNPYKRVPIDDSIPAAYYLPDWLIMFTIIIPFIVVFYLGLRVVQDIMLYRKNVPGTLYKKALNFLAYGIGFTVVSIMALRYLTSLSSAFQKANLQGILALLYLLVLVIAVSYGLIGLGAKRLKKLEEV